MTEQIPSPSASEVEEVVERLKHRAAEHRGFFGSSKDYDLMERAAALLSSEHAARVAAEARATALEARPSSGEGISSRSHPVADAGDPCPAPSPDAEPSGAGERITYGSDGLLDEVSAAGAYLERMDDRSFFLTMERYDGSSVAVWLWAKKGKLQTMIEERTASPVHLRSLSKTARPAHLAPPPASAERSDAAPVSQLIRDELPPPPEAGEP